MSEISNAIRLICTEKGLSYEAVLETIEAALAAAYRKDFGTKTQNIKVKFDPETADIKVYDVKTVVEDMPEEEASDEGDEAKIEEKEPEQEKKPRKKKGEEEKQPEQAKPAEDAHTPDIPEGARSGLVEGTRPELVEGEELRKFNPKTEVQLTDAKFIKTDAQLGDEIRVELPVQGEFGRMAAQTAKQVIIQKLREAERDMIFNEYKDKENEVVSGVVQRKEGKVILVDLGKAIGIIPPEEQIPGEFYRPGARIKVFVKEVKTGPKGPEITLSRISEEILKKVFYLEIPEISGGLIEIMSVAREAGARSKVAVMSEADNVDPIGSCVGQRGARIQTIISELGGEKIDIIEYDQDIQKYIGNALSPAKISSIELDEKEKKAFVTVAADQFSLAIGKNGQNVRLAALLTGWRIDIVEKKDEKKGKKKTEGEDDEDGGGLDAGTEDIEAAQTEADGAPDESDTYPTDFQPDEEKENKEDEE